MSGFELAPIRAEALKTTDPERQSELVEDPALHRLLTINSNLTWEAQRRIIEIGDMYAQTDLTEHPNLDPDLHSVLAASKDRILLSYLARREDLTPQTMIQIASSGLQLAQIALAKNRKLTGDVLTLLLSTLDESVRDACRKNSRVWARSDVPAKLMWMYNRNHALLAQLSTDDRETVQSLAPTWDGNVQSLLEAVKLTRR